MRQVFFVDRSKPAAFNITKILIDNYKELTHLFCAVGQSQKTAQNLFGSVRLKESDIVKP